MRRSVDSCGRCQEESVNTGRRQLVQSPPRAAGPVGRLHIEGQLRHSSFIFNCSVKLFWLTAVLCHHELGLGVCERLFVRVHRTGTRRESDVAVVPEFATNTGRLWDSRAVATE